VVDLAVHAAIGETLARYAYAVDDGDADGVAAVFTEDGELDVGNGVVISGRAALLEFFRNRLARYTASSHHLSNIRIQVDGDRASSVCYVYARIWPVDAAEPGELWARYSDELVCAGEAWSIERRRLRAAGWHGFPMFDDQPDLFERYRSDA
jgi:uncharacterized protein (TIGR02246 family)